MKPRDPARGLGRLLRRSRLLDLAQELVRERRPVSVLRKLLRGDDDEGS